MAAGNFFFSPSSMTLVKGQPVKITFQNSGTHTFTIDELGINEPLRGSSATIEFTPTQSGTFEYYCAIPGHKEAGMFGSLEVE
jgi:nitrite reductase (NO-forming)